MPERDDQQFGKYKLLSRIAQGRTVVQGAGVGREARIAVAIPVRVGAIVADVSGRISVQVGLVVVAGVRTVIIGASVVDESRITVAVSI